MSDTLALEELQQVNDALKEEAEARAHVPPPAAGVRVADVFEDQWGAIRAGALRRLLISDGDHVLQADSYLTLTLTLTLTTLTCFYLAQAHGNLGARERSASYCHRLGLG